MTSVRGVDVLVQGNEDLLRIAHEYKWGYEGLHFIKSFV